MKNFALSLVVAVSALSLSSNALAGHVPSIRVKIDGPGARFVSPELVFNDASETLSLFNDNGTYIADDVVAGSYTLTLVDKDKGDVLMVEPMTLVPSGSHHLTGTNRHITCTFKSGVVECLNNI